MSAPESGTVAPPKLLVPPITPEELARRNQAVIRLLEEWASDVASEQDQIETVEILRKALGPDRIASNREAFR